MQFSKLSLLSVAATSVLAAPAVVTVTQQQQATVVVRGAVYVTDGQTYTTYICLLYTSPSPRDTR